MSIKSIIKKLKYYSKQQLCKFYLLRIKKRAGNNKIDRVWVKSKKKTQNKTVNIYFNDANNFKIKKEEAILNWGGHTRDGWRCESEANWSDVTLLAEVGIKQPGLV